MTENDKKVRCDAYVCRATGKQVVLSNSDDVKAVMAVYEAARVGDDSCTLAVDHMTGKPDLVYCYSVNIPLMPMAMRARCVLSRAAVVVFCLIGAISAWRFRSFFTE